MEYDFSIMTNKFDFDTPLAEITEVWYYTNDEDRKNKTNPVGYTKVIDGTTKKSTGIVTNFPYIKNQATVKC